MNEPMQIDEAKADVIAIASHLLDAEKLREVKVANTYLDQENRMTLLEAENAALRQSLEQAEAERENHRLQFASLEDDWMETENELKAIRVAVQPFVKEACALVKMGWNGPAFVGGHRFDEDEWRALAAFGEDEKE